ncbi:MAG: ion transporter [Candidatus Thiodiazotropha lotti]|nr:ion transporter [Candidatus Thiodiazotropha lotti]MCW4218780.1 ion transporter [Candidatus Thiodiazotropha lotti]
MNSFKQIIESTDSSAGRAFDLIIQFLIVVSLISFSIETIPGLTDTQLSVLRHIEIFCVVVFTVEYISRIIVASNRIKFIFSFFGIIDLLAILPFYLTTGLDLRVVRAFRFLRLFRILKLARYSKAVDRFHMALRLAKEELVLFLAASSVVLYLAAVGIYYFENSAQPETFKSVFHSLWWSVVTLTTVGYGDMFPVTTGGKIFTFVVLLVGLGLVSVPAGLVASSLSRARELESQEK